MATGLEKKLKNRIKKVRIIEKLSQVKMSVLLSRCKTHTLSDLGLHLALGKKKQCTVISRRIIYIALVFLGYKGKERERRAKKKNVCTNIVFRTATW